MRWQWRIPEVATGHELIFTLFKLNRFFKITSLHCLCQLHFVGIRKTTNCVIYYLLTPSTIMNRCTEIHIWIEFILNTLIFQYRLYWKKNTLYRTCLFFTLYALSPIHPKNINLILLMYVRGSQRTMWESKSTINFLCYIEVRIYILSIQLNTWKNKQVE